MCLGEVVTGDKIWYAIFKRREKHRTMGRGRIMWKKQTNKQNRLKSLKEMELRRLWYCSTRAESCYSPTEQWLMSAFFMMITCGNTWRGIWQTKDLASPFNYALDFASCGIFFSPYLKKWSLSGQGFSSKLSSDEPVSSAFHVSNITFSPVFLWRLKK